MALCLQDNKCEACYVQAKADAVACRSCIEANCMDSYAACLTNDYTCLQITQCQLGCASLSGAKAQQACATDCLVSGTWTAQGLYAGFAGCVGTKCGANPTQQCAQEQCATEGLACQNP